MPRSFSAFDPDQKSSKRQSLRKQDGGAERIGCSSHRRDRLQSRRGAQILGVLPWPPRDVADDPGIVPISPKSFGIPGVKIDGAFIDLPGGVILELLDYQLPDRRANPPATSNPGNIHICLGVENADDAWRRAIECGATPVRREGPIAVDDGPNGARASPTFESMTESRWKSTRAASSAGGQP